MKERPILFQSEMVRAILDGRKTQTRRIVKPQPEKWIDRYEPSISPLHWLPSGVLVSDKSGVLGKGPLEVRSNDKPAKCPYGQPGDRLWVRESFYVQESIWQKDHGPQPLHYGATTNPEEVEDYILKPSIHMPRWASRLTLGITMIRVERVQDINSVRHDEVLKEGWPFGGQPKDRSPILDFAELWDQVNGKGSWASNPWVWVVGFKRV